MKKNFTIMAIILFGISMMYLPGLHAEDSKKKNQSVSEIISEIQKLENNRDPKCHATATRLENFMYGTKLTDETRFVKVKLQKQLMLQIWQEVSKKAKADGKSTIKAANYFNREFNRLLPVFIQKSGDMTVKLKTPVTLEKRDIEHYSSVAYALRTILSVQQEVMLGGGPADLVALDSGSVANLKKFLDLFTLTALKMADRKARIANEYVLLPNRLQEAWKNILAHSATKINQMPAGTPGTQTSSGTAGDYKMILEIIKQKVKSYEAYNKISMQVFLRNLQVYFARHKWPKDQVEGKKFRDAFTEAMVSFTFESLKRAQLPAQKKKHRLIREEDVHHMWERFVPFKVNQYEDVIFFPNLGKKGSLTIESYDFDAFRDSGIHWRYLQFAIQDHRDKLSMEPDPFAAELLVEGVAQYGVLVLRMAGMKAKDVGDKHLKTEHLQLALKEVMDRVKRHPLKQITETGQELSSSSNVTRTTAGKNYFDNVTAASGIDFMHRSSDWLSRLLRSYLKKSASVGTLSVPPAFGGSGAASADVNGDGHLDVLLLSGTGNKLYLGDGKGHFKDVTKEAGLLYTGPDGHPGETRQPLMADFDNDGKQDIFISYVNEDHKLYRNMGNGKFKDVSKSSNLGGKNLAGGPSLAFDYNNDGLLDLYIGYFGDYPRGKLPSLNRRNLNGLPNRLFKNKGNFVFEDVTEQSGTGNPGWGQAAAHTDFDLDGRQDIIVGNDFGVNVYYRNKGDGTFENVAARLGTDKPSFTMNVGITDLNRDGFPDIYISNIVTMVKDEKYVLPGKETTMKFNPAKLARMRVIEANDLFLSESREGKLKGLKLSDAVGRGYNSTGWAWGANFFDFDNDGDDDLYCVNGMNEYSVYSDTPYYTNVHKEKRTIQLLTYEKESNVFFVNENGKLVNHSKKSGTDLLGNSRSTVYLDFDNDGDLDIVLNNYHGPAVVYRNNSQAMNNNWLKIKLTGDPAKKCNLDAIGARIIASKNGKQLAWREIRGGDGYLCMNPKVQHMGLGGEKNVDIKVYWPNGEQSEYKDIPVNSKYGIKLGDKEIKKM